MTVRRHDELPLVTLDLRQTGALLAHPCHCGRTDAKDAQ